MHLEWASMCWSTTCSIIPAMHCCLWWKTATHQTQTASFDQLRRLFTSPPFGKRSEGGIVADVDYSELDFGENVNKFELQKNRCTNISPAVQKMPILAGRSKKYFQAGRKFEMPAGQSFVDHRHAWETIAQTKQIPLSRICFLSKYLCVVLTTRDQASQISGDKLSLKDL